MKSTETNYVNRNNQMNIEKLNERGTDNLQWFYQMKCLNCNLLDE